MHSENEQRSRQSSRNDLAQARQSFNTHNLQLYDEFARDDDDTPMQDRVDHKKIAKILGSKNNEDADYHDYHLKKIA